MGLLIMARPAARYFRLELLLNRFMDGLRTEKRKRRSLLARARALKERACSVERRAIRTPNPYARAAFLQAAEELVLEARYLERLADSFVPNNPTAVNGKTLLPNSATPRPP
jgi:hypothetical protein